jgi:hypothetical protein
MHRQQPIAVWAAALVAALACCAVHVYPWDWRGFFCAIDGVAVGFSLMGLFSAVERGAEAERQAQKLIDDWDQRRDTDAL